MHTKLTRLHVRTHHAIDPVTIGQSKRTKTKPMGFDHELFRMTRALEERVVALAPQRRVRNDSFDP